MVHQVEVTGHLNLPAERIWNLLADFGAFLDWAAEGSIETQGEGPGMVRRLRLKGQGLTAERADLIDHATMTLVYTLVEGNPIGMASYQARVQVHSEGPDTSKISWHGEFDAIDESNAGQVGELLTGAYQAMTNSIADYLTR